jgi:hypothetical protein
MTANPNISPGSDPRQEGGVSTPPSCRTWREIPAKDLLKQRREEMRKCRLVRTNPPRRHTAEGSISHDPRVKQNGSKMGEEGQQ